MGRVGRRRFFLNLVCRKSVVQEMQGYVLDGDGRKGGKDSDGGSLESKCTKSELDRLEQVRMRRSYAFC